MEAPSRRIEVVEYNHEWPLMFSRLSGTIWPAVRDVAISIEHVGSTAVPGLAAKPVLDIDVVVGSLDVLPSVVERLRSVGYEHCGNLGVEGREAFREPANSARHHLYVYAAGSDALRNHLVLRNHLRTNATDAAAYGQLKKRLAELFPYDIDSYIAGKTLFITSILGQYGFPVATLDSITEANRVPLRLRD